MNANHRDLRVLVVEDDFHFQTLIKRIFEHLGFRSTHIFDCSDGAEAIEFLKVQKVDFIICDWVMKPLDGLTFLRMLRNPKETPAPNMPVILCSGWLDREAIAEMQSAGVNEAIVKPITIGAIESRVRAIFERPRPIIENEEYVGPDRRRRDMGVGPRERRAKPRKSV